MKNHTKIYFSFFGYTIADWIKCEIPTCKNQAVDINHIKARGMGGSKHRDNIENLMAMCRSCHLEFGDKQQYRGLLYEIHKKNIDEKTT